MAERKKSRHLFEQGRGVFMISVAAELAGMHPQTLRLYEARGLIKPSRSPKKTRLYSQADVQRLRRIQQLTSELGLNLAGVERVMELEASMAEMRAELEAMSKQVAETQRRMLEEIDAVHRSYKRELVRWQPPGDILRSADASGFQIPIHRTSTRRTGER